MAHQCIEGRVRLPVSLLTRHLTLCRYVRYIVHEFEELGLPTATQAYQIKTTLMVNTIYLAPLNLIDPSISQTHQGENVYASLSAPRASNFETIVLCASWLSLSLRSGSSSTHSTNLRGIASVMALARHFKRTSCCVTSTGFALIN